MGARYFGAEVLRGEDRPLITGEGQYVDDIRMPGTLHGAYVRSPHAHALIKSIDTREALALDGVHAVFTFADLDEPMNRPATQTYPSPLIKQDLRPFPLAKEEVCYVGETIAFIVADTRHIAEDAIPLVAIEFDILDGYITVISPVPDSPSDHVGLQSGDRITAINGEDAYKITKDEVVKKLRGKKGTSVDITIQRIGLEEPFDVTIIRDDIPIYSVGAATMIDDETGYILLRRFSATTNEEVNKAIDKLDKQNFKRLVFDLRGNSGGYLEQAAAISRLFITTKDTVVYTKGKISDANQAFLSDPKKGRDDFSLIILINRGSASASEIVSGAVQDFDRGLIIGETSFGKGLVQRQLPLEGGSAIRITMARYYTPSGRLIQRPYKEGDDLTYYKELYSKDREKTLDSLKQLRPKFKTKKGRTVYGGGGITPDIHIAYKSELTKSTQEILRNPERPIFNFSSTYATENDLGISNFKNFKNTWEVNQGLYSQFLDYLDNDSIKYNPDSLKHDKDFLFNRIKSEIAGTLWGKDESASIRLDQDNQVSEALKYFNEADAFLR